MWKMSLLVYSAGIRTQYLKNMSLLPFPIDQGFNILHRGGDQVDSVLTYFDDPSSNPTKVLCIL